MTSHRASLCPVRSMADNRSRELAFESVALISKALCLLEAGQLGVLSFGEEVKLLHPLHDTFSDVSGPRYAASAHYYKLR